MRAVVFEGIGRFGVHDVPRPEPHAPDDVLLRIDAAGICGSDLHILEDPPGYPAVAGTVLGHEFTGTVVEVGAAVTELRAGDRVIAEPRISCQQCAYCARGFGNLCRNLVETGTMRDGGLAEYAVMPARNLHRVPESVSVDAAPLIEPLAGCMSGASKARIVPGDTVVVLGGGTIGLLYLQIYRAAGAGKVIVVEPRAVRAERALALGADLVLDPAQHDLEARVLRETEIGADVVIDAVGAGFVSGLSLLRLGGSMVVFGLDARVREPVQQFQITMKELKIFGSLSGAFGFRQAIRFMAAGGISTDAMVTHRFGLDDALTAIETLRGGDAIKVLIRPHG